MALLSRWPKFSPSLDHELRVEPDEDRRPGERLLTPTPSLHAPRLTRDHCRQDFRVRVGRKRSSLAAVCLGPERDHGTPEQRVAKIDDPHHMKDFSKGAFVGRTIGGQSALGMRVELTTSVLIDWHVNYAGWAYVVGVLINRGDDPADVLDLAFRTLDTWQWLPPHHPGMR